MSCIPFVSNTYCGVVFLCLSFSCVLHTLGIQHILWCVFLCLSFSCVLYTLGVQHILWCGFPLFVFLLCLVYPWCPTHIVVWFSFVCLSPVSCIPLVSNTYCGVVFLCLSFSCVLYTLGIQHILWCGFPLFVFLLCPVYPWCPPHIMVWFSFACLSPVSCIPLVSNTYYGVVFLCLSFSCVLYTLGIQHILWCGFPLFVFLLCLVYPWCPTHIVVWFSFVCLSPVSCIPLVSNTYCGVVIFCLSFSCVLYTLGIQHILWCGFPLFVFLLCLVYPWCPTHIVVWFSFVCLSPVSCIPLVSNTYCGVVFLCVSFSCALYALGVHHILWCGFPLLVFLLCLVYPWCPTHIVVWFSFVRLSPVSCIPLVSNTYCGVVFLCLSFSCALYALGVQHILWCGFPLFVFLLCFVYSWYPTHIVVWFSFVRLSPVSCIPLVSNTYCGVVFLCLSFSCILYTLCCQFLWIVQFWLLLRYYLTFICTYCVGIFNTCIDESIKRKRWTEIM